MCMSTNEVLKHSKRYFLQLKAHPFIVLCSIRFDFQENFKCSAGSTVLVESSDIIEIKPGHLSTGRTVDFSHD